MDLVWRLREGPGGDRWPGRESLGAFGVGKDAGAWSRLRLPEDAERTFRPGGYV